MDVTPSRLDEATPRPAAQRLAEGGRPQGAVATATGPPQSDDSPAAAPAEAPWAPRSILKTGLNPVDVDVTFEIDRDSSRVMVTMTDRLSGEVLRQIPPREMDAVVRTLAGRGLIVDLER